MNRTESHPTWFRPLTEPLSDLLSRWVGSSSTPTEPGSSDPSELARLILLDASRESATDLHLEPNSQGWRIRMRIDGVLHDTAELPAELGQRLLQHLKTLAGLDPGPVFEPNDSHLSYDVEDRRLDIRLACVPCQFGEKAALRILDPMRVRRRIEQLGLAADQLEEIRHWLGNISGMCLVAGPTSSGKTTTLYALLHELQLVNRSIVTIEDPVEYEIDGITQIQVDERRGLTFPEGLKAMLRLDPDYLVLGETRDPLSARIAVEASGTGRVLMSTLHSRDAVGVVTTLRNWNLSDAEITASLELVIAQRLVRKLCEKCRREEPATPEIQRWLEAFGLAVPKRVWRPAGYRACHKTGYTGRTGLFELWRKTEEDYDAILGHADERTLRRKVAKRHRKTLLDSGLAQARLGVTSLEEVKASAISVLAPAAVSKGSERRGRRQS
jgi:general secretion pathway protein E